MKLKVIGCSNSWTPRFSSCYLVNDNILMDCGADAYKGYIQTGKDFHDIKLFLITHFHADHIYGLNVFLTALHRKPSLYPFKPTFVGPKGVKEACHRVFETSNLFAVDFSDVANFVEVENGDSFDFEDIKITAKKLDHGDVEDFGFLLSQKGRTLGYTGDSTVCDNLIDFIEASDVCILHPSRMQSNAKHLGANDFETLVKQYPNKILLAGHCDEDVYNLPLIKRNRVEEGMEIEI